MIRIFFLQKSRFTKFFFFCVIQCRVRRVFLHPLLPLPSLSFLFILVVLISLIEFSSLLFILFRFLSLSPPLPPPFQLAFPLFSPSLTSTAHIFPCFPSFSFSGKKEGRKKTGQKIGIFPSVQTLKQSQVMERNELFLLLFLSRQSSSSLDTYPNLLTEVPFLAAKWHFVHHVY